MTENISPNRPLLTFALFAYNQEQYIREAVEGAFAQTYEPLEIILSDDCSTDRTFEIMQEMAAAYDGPHQVRVRRPAENVGVLAHLLGVAYEAKGHIMVVAAGDDISLPERTVILSTQFTSDEIAAVSSDDIVIDENGDVRDWYPERIENRKRWHQRDSTSILGATAAYRSDLLKTLPLPRRKILHEDTALEDMLKITVRKSAWLEQKLIKRRSHLNNIYFRNPGDISVDQCEHNTLARWVHIADVKEYCAEAALYLNPERNALISRKYKESTRYFTLLANWPHLTIGDRMELMALGSRHGALRAWSRLLGLRMFRFLKRIDLLLTKSHRWRS